MGESIHLHGAEDVRKAGFQMTEAAETMRRAAAQIDEALQRHERFLDDWLTRLQDALSNQEKK